MRNPTQSKKFFARVLIALATFSSTLARITGQTLPEKYNRRIQKETSGPMNRPMQHRSWILGICRRAASASVFVAVLLPAVITARSAQAQTFTTVKSFDYADGAYPTAALVQATDGNLYGTTFTGGLWQCNIGGCGTVFKITRSGTLTTLHNFSGGDGATPYAGLVQATDGNLYGTSSGAYAPGSYGTVFEITPSGTLTTLHSFNSTDGAFPFAGLVQATNGNFYGTTSSGGANGYGTVFEITPSGTLTTLHNFDSTDGATSYGALVQATDGDFYGTTFAGGGSGCGGTGCGTVFKITASGTLTTLHTFVGEDGANSYAGLIQATDGNFYGTTSGTYAPGNGTVFKITPSGALTTLHSFDGADGSLPYAGLIQATDGELYGTTPYSGGYACCGSVFKITLSGTLTSVYNSFCTKVNCSDGAEPLAGLVQTTGGSFYGTTGFGGLYGETGGTSGYGVVFRLSFGYATSSTLVSSLNPSVYGQGVTWTATVATSGPVAPTGKVNFTWGGNSIGSATLNSSGLATLTRSNLNADIFPLTAVYSGDVNNLRSTSAIVNQVVTETTSAATLTSSLNPSVEGQRVTFTAKVSSPTVITRGPVTFSIGKTVVGTAQLSGGEAKLAISSLPVGSTKVTVTYYGDSNIAKSSASVIQTVQ